MAGELVLQAGDPGLGALHLLLHAGQLAGIGEQLPGLGVPVAGQLHQQRSLLQHGRAGHPRLSTPATDVAPVSSNAAAAACATLACAALNWALA